MDLHVEFKNDKNDDREIIKAAFKIKNKCNVTRSNLSQKAHIIDKNIDKFLLDHKSTKQFKTVLAAHRWAFPRYEKWVEGLTSNEYSAIFKYCYGGTDKRINAFYQQKSEELTCEDRLVANFLESALEKSYVPEDLVVYRGKRGDSFKEVLKLQKDEIIGKSIVEKGFMSTSLVESVAKKHEKGIMLKINVPKGAKGGYVGTISEHLEAEILFGLNKELIIKNVEEKNNVTVIECDLIEENDDMSETRSIYSISEDESINSGFHLAIQK